jgi:hypothetical protein
MSQKEIKSGITLGSTAAGAGIGAGIGSIVPGVGTLIGAGIGAVAGNLLGNATGLMIKDDPLKKKFQLRMTQGDPNAGYRLGDLEKDYAFQSTMQEQKNTTLGKIMDIGTQGILTGTQISSMFSKPTMAKPKVDSSGLQNVPTFKLSNTDPKNVIMQGNKIKGKFDLNSPSITSNKQITSNNFMNNIGIDYNKLNQYIGGYNNETFIPEQNINRYIMQNNANIKVPNYSNPYLDKKTNNIYEFKF